MGRLFFLRKYAPTVLHGHGARLLLLLHGLHHSRLLLLHAHGAGRLLLLQLLHRLLPGTERVRDLKGIVFSFHCSLILTTLVDARR